MKKSQFKVMSSAALATALAVPAVAGVAPQTVDAAETAVDNLVVEKNGEVSVITYEEFVNMLLDGEEAGTIKAVSSDEVYYTYEALVDATLDNPDSDLSEIIDMLADDEDAMVSDDMLAEWGLGVNLDVESVSAINNTTVEVKFVEPVSDVDAIDFSIEGLTIENAVVKQTDDRVVYLTTEAHEAGQEYTVMADDEVLGSFETVSAVVPDAIDFVSESKQSVVGKEVTLKADVGVKEAGIPVTFNVDAPTDSLNEDHKFEVYTNEDGIAEYSYTQYNDGVDNVAVYPTTAPAVRDNAKVYWGVDNILTVSEDEADSTLANGEEKTYTVKYLDPETGEPVSNEELNVTFLENVNVKPSDVTNAVVGDPSYGNVATPYQTTDGEENGVIVETDANGEATFSVSGTNTSVTPVVFLNSDRDDLDQARWDATELQAIASKVTFSGAQETNEFTVEGEDLTASLNLVSDEDEAAAGYDNGRKYSVTVTDEDGEAYDGGIVNVALQEDIDDLRSTNTDADIKTVDSDDLLGTILNGRNDAEIQLKLNDEGKAEFVVYGEDDEVATPIVWIDQNNAQNTQSGVLESGEPRLIAETTNFEQERVVGAILGVDGKDGTDVTLENAPLNVTFNPVNQSGMTLNDVPYDVTYVVRNTGSEPVSVDGYGYEDGEGDAIAYGTTIEVGGSLTLNKNIASGKDTFSITGAEGASVSVRATGVTEDDFSSDNREENLRLVPAQVIEADFAGEPETTLFTGTVMNLDEDANTFELNINGDVESFDYTDGVLFTTDSESSVSEAYFEQQLSEGDTVTYRKDGDRKEFEIVSNTDPVDSTIPTMLSANATDNQTLEVTFDETVTSSATAANLASQFSVDEDDDTTTADVNNATSASISGNTVTLTFPAGTFASSDIGEVTYREGSVSPLEDLAGNDVATPSTIDDSSTTLSFGASLGSTNDTTVGTEGSAESLTNQITAGASANSSNFSVTVTNDNGPVGSTTVPNIVTGDSPSVVANKVADAINADATLSPLYTATTNNDTVVLTQDEGNYSNESTFTLTSTDPDSTGVTFAGSNELADGVDPVAGVFNTEVLQGNLTGTNQSITAQVTNTDGFDQSVNVTLLATDETVAEVRDRIIASLNANPTVSTRYTADANGNDVRLTEVAGTESDATVELTIQ
ncbi:MULTISPECIES: hypothetical protein [Pontibacillus]|uniref:Uncharacterized protein n=1 Tax=Pontibacillus chungwhensis TaxID=265426 RepID=A0ABY8UVY1_9BACI|nr:MULTISPECIES: hypothetical protein [Pontibacillus]MCD5324107.1 hypothetical protein [Pontibacillus sp. HN14]WIF97836.1 hypothetical protein QNI29_19245 [Pontibacillus chungwhensis]